VLTLASGQKRKNPPLLNHPFWLVAYLRAMITVHVHHSEILRKRISWMVAQTIAKQLVSVVKTSI